MKGEVEMDEYNIKELLSEQIAGEFGDLASLETGSEEHARAVDDLVKLYKLRIDESKADSDTAANAKDRYLRLGMEIAGLVLPLVFYAHWMKLGFKFEETGAFTSTTFRGLFNRFRPTGR